MNASRYVLLFSVLLMFSSIVFSGSDSGNTINGNYDSQPWYDGNQGDECNFAGSTGGTIRFVYSASDDAFYLGCFFEKDFAYQPDLKSLYGSFVSTTALSVDSFDVEDLEIKIHSICSDNGGDGFNLKEGGDTSQFLLPSPSYYYEKACIPVDAWKISVDQNKYKEFSDGRKFYKVSFTLDQNVILDEKVGGKPLKELGVISASPSLNSGETSPLGVGKFLFTIPENSHLEGGNVVCDDGYKDTTPDEPVPTCVAIEIPTSEPIYPTPNYPNACPLGESLVTPPFASDENAKICVSKSEGEPCVIGMIFGSLTGSALYSFGSNGECTSFCLDGGDGGFNPRKLSNMIVSGQSKIFQDFVSYPYLYEFVCGDFDPSKLDYLAIKTYPEAIVNTISYSSPTTSGTPVDLKKNPIEYKIPYSLVVLDLSKLNAHVDESTSTLVCNDGYKDTTPDEPVPTCIPDDQAVMAALCLIQHKGFNPQTGECVSLSCPLGKVSIKSLLSGSKCVDESTVPSCPEGDIPVEVDPDSEPICVPEVSIDPATSCILSGSNYDFTTGECIPKSESTCTSSGGTWNSETNQCEQTPQQSCSAEFELDDGSIVCLDSATPVCSESFLAPPIFGDVSGAFSPSRVVSYSLVAENKLVSSGKFVSGPYDSSPPFLCSQDTFVFLSCSPYKDVTYVSKPFTISAPGTVSALPMFVSPSSTAFDVTLKVSLKDGSDYSLKKFRVYSTRLSASDYNVVCENGFPKCKEGFHFASDYSSCVYQCPLGQWSNPVLNRCEEPNGNIYMPNPDGLCPHGFYLDSLENLCYRLPTDQNGCNALGFTWNSQTQKCEMPSGECTGDNCPQPPTPPQPQTPTEPGLTCGDSGDCKYVLVLQKGWNLAGIPSNIEITDVITSMSSCADGDLSSLWTISSSPGGFKYGESYTYSQVQSPSLERLQTSLSFNAGSALWVKSQKSCQITFESTQSTVSNRPSLNSPGYSFITVGEDLNPSELGCTYKIGGADLGPLVFSYENGAWNPIVESQLQKYHSYVVGCNN